MSTQENPFAGQGPVLLDIGGDVGALVVTMPPALAGVEVEIRPIGHHDHSCGPGGQPDHGGDGRHLPHVAVVARPAVGGHVHSLVFPELTAGDYELYQRPAGPVELTVSVAGGQVTQARWPAAGKPP
jgi:hypothetical protein